MLPELDVFHAHRDQLVHPEGVALHHKDLVFVPPAGQQVQRQVQCPAPTGWLTLSGWLTVKVHAELTKNNPISPSEPQFNPR